ncbi:hypothetical protein Chor_003813, partial [Crotalus horridus]
RALPGWMRAGGMADIPVNPGITPAGPRMGPGPAQGADALFVALSAGFTVLSHPLLYVKLLVQVGHEPLPPTIGRNLLGRKVFYFPGFFTYARHIVEVDGKMGLFRGLSPRIITSVLSTINREQMKKAFPLEDLEHVSNKDDMKTSLRKVTKETCHEMTMQCVSRIISHPLHVISMRCMVQFVGREVKYRLKRCKRALQPRSNGFPLSTAILLAQSRQFGKKKDSWDSLCKGLVPHVLGDLIFLWCCNLLAHFINTYAVDDNFNQASVIRSYTKFVMGIAVSMLTYPFLLVGDLMAVNNCGFLCYVGYLLGSLHMPLCFLLGFIVGDTLVLRGNSSEVPAYFFVEHPHQQLFSLTNFIWEKEANLDPCRRNSKAACFYRSVSFVK